MHFSHVHSTPERFLLIALIVFPLVFLFNAYRLGRLKRTPYALLSLALLLLAALFFLL